MDMRRYAQFSACGAYRYRLERRWNSALPLLAFIGLNPSTADAAVDDPTIRRCIGFAQEWGYGGIIMLNIFAFRATRPEALQRASDPVGPRNRQTIATALRHIDVVVACWGNHGHDTPAANNILRRYGSSLHYLRKNRNGAPAHPLYLPKTLQPIRWRYESGDDGG